MATLRPCWSCWRRKSRNMREVWSTATCLTRCTVPKEPWATTSHIHLLRTLLRNQVWLVVSTPLKNISQLGWLFPNIWENTKCSKPPTRSCCLPNPLFLCPRFLSPSVPSARPCPRLQWARNPQWSTWSSSDRLHVLGRAWLLGFFVASNSSIYLSTSPSINQPINQATNQPTNQPIIIPTYLPI